MEVRDPGKAAIELTETVLASRKRRSRQSSEREWRSSGCHVQPGVANSLPGQGIVPLKDDMNAVKAGIDNLGPDFKAAGAGGSFEVAKRMRASVSRTCIPFRTKACVL